MKNKRLLISLGVLVTLLACTLFLFSRFVRLPLLGVYPEEAIDYRAGMVLEFHREWIDSTGSGVGGSVPLFAFPPVVLEELFYFEENLGSVLELPRSGPVLAIVQPTSSGTDVLFVFDGFRGLDIASRLRGAEWRLRKSSFKGHSIYHGRGGQESFSVSRYRNLLLLSRHAYLVENAIEQLRHPARSVCRDEAFRMTSRSLSATPHCVRTWWNLAQLRTAFSPMLEPLRLTHASRLSSFGKWLSIQVPLAGADSSASWQGAFVPNRDNALVAAAMKSRERPYRPIFGYVPSGLAMFVWAGLEGYHPAQRENWENFMVPWVGNEILAATGQPLSSLRFEQFILLAVNKGADADSYLAKWAAGNSEAYQMFNIHTLPGDAIQPMLGGRPSFDTTWCVSLGEYVLFTNSRRGVERWLDAFIVENTLSKDPAFLKTIRELPPKAMAFVHVDGGLAWQVIGSWLGESIQSRIHLNPLGTESLTAVFKKQGEGLTIQFAPSHQANDKVRPALVLWRAPLQAPLTIPPVPFFDPSKGEYFIFAQDGLRHLYLYSSTGQLVWRRPFDEVINSSCYAIDIDNDKQPELAFGTPHGIYVLRIDGTPLPGFPIRLVVPASSPLTVVDFFKSHDYSFFIGCENGKVYGFAEDGTPLEGWRPNDSTGVLYHPLRHFQANGMDFLVALDAQSVLRVFRKNGERRFGDIALEGAFPSPPGIQVLGPRSRIVACNDTGLAWAVNTTGNYFRLKLRAGKGGPIRFLLADVSGDELCEYLALADGELACYGYEGPHFKRWFSCKPLPEGVDLFEVRWPASSKAFIGVVDALNRQISMVDGRGRVLPQFPLAGDTAFQLIPSRGTGLPLLITGLQRQIYAYQLMPIKQAPRIRNAAQ